MSIDVENDKTEYYKLDIDKNNKKLLELTIENVAKVEAMIKMDSTYCRTSDREAMPQKTKRNNYSYLGSTAYWFTHLNEELCKIQECDKLSKIPENDIGKIKNNKMSGNVIYKVVWAIDRENSTHLNADNVGREEITERICSYTKKDFLENLGSSDINIKYKIYEHLAERTTSKYGNRTRQNISFASKFCHYACFYLFKEEDIRDNFSIYDNILAAVIPYYAERYLVKSYTECRKMLKNKTINVYKDYCEVVDKIRSNLDCNISRNGFDHLLWYYHKGRLQELKR